MDHDRLRATAWDGNQAGTYRHIDSGGSSARDQVEIEAVVEKQLRDEEIGARLHFHPHVSEFVLQVGALRVLFRAACGTDAKPVAVAAHECHQVAAVNQLWVGGMKGLTWSRRIAAEREHVAD